MATISRAVAKSISSASTSRAAGVAIGVGGLDEVVRCNSFAKTSDHERHYSKSTLHSRPLVQNHHQKRTANNNNELLHDTLLTLQQKRFFGRGFTKRKKRAPKFNKSADGFDYYSSEDEDSDSEKSVLVVGSSGVLGRAVVNHLSKQLGCHVMGADVVNNTHQPEDGLDGYIPLPKEGSVADLSVMLYRGVKNHFQDLLEEEGEDAKTKFDAIVCASGGWEGDVNVDAMVSKLAKESKLSGESFDVDEEYVKQSAEVVERMMTMNFNPIVAGSQIGQRFMTPGGLFVMIGASAALSPTPGMIGYGSAKNAAHHYLQTWGITSSQTNDTTAIGILPLMLDTPANRAIVDNNKGDGYNQMVKPAQIAREIGEWIKHPHMRPHSGSLVKVIAKNRADGSGSAAFHLVR